MALNRSDKSVQQYTDIEIIQQVLAGNTAVFEIMIRRYNPYLYKVGRSYGFNHQDTEDLMQETFINSYVNLKQFAERSSFKTWLIRIMLNQCYRKAHKFNYLKEQTTDILPDNSSFMFLPSHNNNDAVISKEFNKVVEACLQQLPQEYRTTYGCLPDESVQISPAALMFEGPTNRAPAGRLAAWPIRPVCINCIKILAPFACTALVTNFQAVICCGEKIPGILE